MPARFDLFARWSGQVAAVCCLCTPAGSAELRSDLLGGSAPSPALAELRVDGEPVALGHPPEVPANHQSVSFRAGRSPAADRPGERRVRFRLEGVDPGWRLFPSEMSLMVRFANAAGDQVGQRIFSVGGESDGWRANLPEAAFTARQENLRVPAGATVLTLAISSSGPPTAMGVYAVRDLRIYRAAPAGRTLVFLGKVEPGEQVSRVWRRSGTRPSMAKLMPTSRGLAFAVVDDAPSAHAEWNLAPESGPLVTPGETLTLEWSEAYHVSTGDRFETSYGHLNAGRYRFVSQALEVSGRPVGQPQVLTFVVLDPLWRRPWVWLSTLAAGSALLWLGGRVVIRRRIRQQVAAVEREHLIAQERLRIARDLHDDLGARLTHISLVSGLAESQSDSTEARESFRRISAMSRELVAALYQTVWTVSPENDQLEALVNFLCQQAQNLCEAAGVRCRIHSDPMPPGWRVTSELRHQVTMVVKEALNNALKHARASEITMRVSLAAAKLQIALEDNGQGFDVARVAGGRGLENMCHRLAQLGGSLEIDSNPGAGSRVSFTVPLPPSVP